jgi:hypothetical protein
MAMFYQGIWPWAERYNKLICVNRLLSKVLEEDLKRDLSAIKRVGASDGSNGGPFHSQEKLKVRLPLWRIITNGLHNKAHLPPEESKQEKVAHQAKLLISVPPPKTNSTSQKPGDNLGPAHAGSPANKRMKYRTNIAFVVKGMEVPPLVKGIKPRILPRRLRKRREKLPSLGFLYFVEEWAAESPIF